MEGVKMWLSSMAAADFFDTGIQNLFPDTTSASIQAVTALRNSLLCTYFMYVMNNSAMLDFLTAHRRLLSE
jgi:hypothetical protein